MNQELKRENNHTRFLWMLGALLALIFARYALYIDIPRILFLVIIALMVLCGDQTEGITTCICLIPLHESVDFYYAMAICVGIYIFKYFRTIKIGPSIVVFLMMAVWEILHCFRADFSLLNLLVPIVPLIVLLLVMSADVSKIDFAFLARALAFATASICITMLVQVFYWSGFNIAQTLLELRRLGVVSEAEDELTITGGTVQTNSLGVICVLVMSGLLQLRLVKKHRKADIAFILILLFFGALTSSRTFLVCLALMVFLLICGNQGSLSSKIRFIGVIIAVIVITLFLLNLFFPDLLTYFVGRFEEEDITTGRDVLMVQYHRFIIENPSVLFWGIGLQDYGHTLTDVYRVARNVPHNSIQEIIVAWGLPGLAFIVSLVVLIFKRSRRYALRFTLLGSIPLILILFKSMAGQLLTSGYSMLALSFAYLSMCQDFSEVKRQDKLTRL